jgi:hypothetical protein
MAKLQVTNQSAAGTPTPSSGNTLIFVDDVTKKLKSKDDTGTVTDYSAVGSSITSLTGEVTATGPGAAAATVTNSAVTGKVLTGLTDSSGAVLATDTILQALSKVNSFSSLGNFGNGTDGNVTILADTTLVRDMYYNNLTITSGTLFPNGYRIHVLDTCTVAAGAFIARSGTDATTSAAVAALTTGTLSGGTLSGAGGGVGAGAAGGASASSAGGSGGAGGAGGAGAGGAAGANTVIATNNGGVEILNTVPFGLRGRDLANALVTTGSGGGGGGGGGGANSGGGGGAGGGIIVVVARTLTGAGTLIAKGGNGASGQGANGGGGGGGGGGVIVTITTNDVTMTSLVFSVAGGTPGTGVGTGLTGIAGGIGRIYRLRA